MSSSLDKSCSKTAGSVLQQHPPTVSNTSSAKLSIEQVRQGVREYGKGIVRVDSALKTLKNQLTMMREEDLALLRRLIHIGDTIRSLSRHHRHAHGKRDHNQRNQELMTSAADLSVTLRRQKGRSGSLLGGDYMFNTVPLVRRQSAPQVCVLPRDVSFTSRRDSNCSYDWSSEDALDFGSSEDGLDTYDSEDDFLDDWNSIRTLPARIRSMALPLTKPQTTDLNDRPKSLNIGADSSSFSAAATPRDDTTSTAASSSKISSYLPVQFGLFSPDDDVPSSSRRKEEFRELLNLQSKLLDSRMQIAKQDDPRGYSESFDDNKEARSNLGGNLQTKVQVGFRSPQSLSPDGARSSFLHTSNRDARQECPKSPREVYVPSLENITESQESSSAGNRPGRPYLDVSSAQPRMTVFSETAAGPKSPQASALLRPISPISPSDVMRSSSPRGDCPQRSVSPHDLRTSRPKSPLEMLALSPNSPLEAFNPRPKSPLAMFASRPKSPLDISTSRPKSPLEVSTSRPKSPLEASTSRPKSPLEMSRPKSPVEMVVSRQKSPKEMYVSHPKSPSESPCHWSADADDNIQRRHKSPAMQCNDDTDIQNQNNSYANGRGLSLDSPQHAAGTTRPVSSYDSITRPDSPQRTKSPRPKSHFDHVHRPKSHSVVAATYLSGAGHDEDVKGGNSSYSVILNQNVKLWKNRLELAQNVKQRISVLEEENS